MPGHSTPRTVPVSAPTIIPATDLGNVEVAKEGNLYLLTDPRGDIRLDGRGLGLYELDTRILSTSILRLNGAQLTLLRGPYRDDGADTIQLTNPELRRNPADKRTAGPSLARRELSVTRTRRIEGVLREQVTIESYSAMTEALEIELGLGVDMADIFEVRGYPRTARGTLCPIEVYDDRLVFAYDGLDGRRRTTTVTLDKARIEPVDDHDAWPGASVIARWRSRLKPGRKLTIEWTVGNATEPSGSTPPPRPTRGRRGCAHAIGVAVCACPDASFEAASRAPVRRPACRFGPRAARPDARPLDRRPGRAAQRRAAGRRALPGRGDPVVRDAVRARQHHRRARDGRVHPVASPSRRSMSWPACRPRPMTRGTTRSRARSSTRCGPARWHGPVRRRMTPTTAASIRPRSG